MPNDPITNGGAQDSSQATGGGLPTGTAGDPRPTPKFQAPDPAAQTGQPAPAAASGEPGISKEEAMALRAERDALQTRQDEAEAAKLAEQGKFKELYEKEVSSRKNAEGRMRERLMRAEVRAYAVSEGILDPDMADLIPTKGIKFNDESGVFEGIKEAIASHRESKTSWYKAAQAPGATGEPKAPVSTGSAQPAPAASAPATPDVSKMNKEEYARYKRDFVNKLRVVR